MSGHSRGCRVAGRTRRPGGRRARPDSGIPLAAPVSLDRGCPGMWQAHRPRNSPGTNEYRGEQPMSRPTKRSLRGAASLVLALSAMLSAACAGSTPAGSTPAGSTPTRQARLDPKLHDLLPQSVKDRGVLRVGTDASYPPIEAYGPDRRTIIGMDPDLGVEIGRILGVRLQFGATNFDELLADVARGDLDLAMSAMTDTPERA